MAVLITGGHGHIGSWAARWLARQGERVLLYDRQPQRPDCLAEVARRVDFIPGDVLDFARLTDVFHRRRGEIDGIIHTVGIMGEMVLENPHGNAALNIGGTLNVLEIARIFEIPKVVYTSTGAVYGAIEGTAGEATHPANPSDLYSATKLSSELLGRQYGQTFGLDFRIARVYFCYGPGKMPSDFIRLYQLAFGALEGMEGLEMERGADQRLDFTHIADAGRGTAMLYRAENPAHTAYNIATGVATPVGEVVRLARKYSAFPVPVALGPGELMRRCQALDIRRASQELGYQPRWELDAGVQNYAEWMTRKLGR